MGRVGEDEVVLDFVLTESWTDFAVLCEVRRNQCWVPRVKGRVRCRANGDQRPDNQLPVFKPHRWAWLISHNYADDPRAARDVQLRHKCGTTRCCNPDHLYSETRGPKDIPSSEAVLSASSAPLSFGKRPNCQPDHLHPTNDALQDVPRQAGDPRSLLPPSYGEQHARSSVGEEHAQPLAGPDEPRLVLSDDLDEIASWCRIDELGCWIAPKPGPVPCRSTEDDVERSMAAHRWVWMVTHGYAQNPLPGNKFHVRRRCRNGFCCNPEHLFLASTDGSQLNTDDIERILRLGASSSSESSNDTRSFLSIGKHNAQTSWPAQDYKPTSPTAEHPAEPRLDSTEHTPSPDPSPTIIRPYSWIDAFPWLRGVSGKQTEEWWLEPIEEASAQVRAERLATVSALAMERLSRWTIGQIFPGLPPTLDLSGLNLPNRAVNVLGREKCFRGADLIPLDLATMLDWRNVGALTVDAILQALADASTLAVTPTVLTDSHDNSVGTLPPPDPKTSRWAWSVLNDLTTAARWLNLIGFPSEPILQSNQLRGVPEEVVRACKRIVELTADDILSEREQMRDIAGLLEDSLSQLDARAITVLSGRLFADEPVTLDELGRQYGVTRERIRQIEGPARGTIMNAISGEGPLATVAAMVRDLIGTIRQLDDLIEVIPALDRVVQPVNQPAWRILDRLDDAYEIEDGWCVVPTVNAALEFTRTHLAERANQYGVIRLDELDLVQVFSPERQVQATIAWLTHCGYIVYNEFVLTRTSSVGDYAASILSIEGSPLSAQEITDRFAFERSARGLGNALGGDDRFERVDRDRWALKEWGLEAYTSIRTIIRELVANGGGQARLDDVVEHITSRYSVSGSSVIAYASAAPFVTKGGIVRFGSERTARKAPRQTRRLFRRPDGWAYRVRITADHLRGSGSVAPMAITTILNLEQGETVQLHSPLGPQAIAWTGIQPQFGTIRRFLMNEDIAVGTEVFLVIHDNRAFSFEQARDLVGNPLADALALIGARPTADPRKARSALASAIELPEDAPLSSIIGDYRTRGDDDIADRVLEVRVFLETGHVSVERVHEADVNQILDLL